MFRPAVTASTGAAFAALFGLVTYEVVILVVASLALGLAVLSLVIGQDNRRDLKSLVRAQNERAGDLVRHLEDDLAEED